MRVQQQKLIDELEAIGGHLECTVCKRQEELGNNIALKLATGWPKCCGYTMTWITARQENGWLGEVIE